MIAAKDVRGEIDKGNTVGAANLVLRFDGLPESVRDEQEAARILAFLIHSLINAGKWALAGYVQFGKKCDPRPRFVREVFDFWARTNRGLVLGGGSTGKTYTTSCFFYLWFWQDPLWTTLKIISQTREHAARNIFATLTELHNNAVVPFTGTINDGVLTANKEDKRHGIMQVAIAKGESGEGILKGFHPIPREGEPHPQFGAYSRVAALADEGEHVAKGVWNGFDNMLLAMEEDSKNVRAGAVTNPGDITSEFAYRATPPETWAELDWDSRTRWRSNAGWDVLRVDGLKCENVILGREIYIGFVTKAGVDNIRLTKGLNSGPWATLVRGAYPRVIVANAVISQNLLDRMIGGFIWQARPTPIAALDPALAGDDDAVLTIGLTGIATHWTKMEKIIDADTGKVSLEMVQHRFPKPTRCALADLQMVLPKGDSADVGAAAIKELKAFQVEARNASSDATGSSEGVATHIKKNYGPILTIIFNGKASDEPILEDFRPTDQRKGKPDPKLMSREQGWVASDRYVDRATEMAFAIAFWAEYNVFKISPTCVTHELSAQTVARRYKNVAGGKAKLNEKALDAVGGKSPDKFDSMIQIVEVVRRADNSMPLTSDPAKQDARNKAIEEARWRAKNYRNPDDFEWNE